MTQERILVVEDEPTVAEVVDRYLRRDGYNVCVAHDGLDGMEAYDRFQPDLVVLERSTSWSVSRWARTITSPSRSARGNLRLE